MSGQKVILFTDLDNTIIHSHRHEILETKVVAEKIDERVQSYINKRLRDYLAEQNWLQIVPVTMRTTNQYLRLKELSQSLNIDQALICNGAIRLKDFETDHRWIKESEAIIRQEQLAEFDGLLSYCESIMPEGSIVLTYPFMFYIKAESAEEVRTDLESKADRSHITIYNDKHKVYCLPYCINKGLAIKRWINLLGDHSVTIAMGDDAPDIPMLDAADYAICTDNIYKEVKAKKAKYGCDFRQSEMIVNTLELIRSEVSVI